MSTTYNFLSNNEEIIKEGKANMQLSIKNVNLGLNKGGTLILTNARLIFIANGFNLGNKYDEINLSEIVTSGKGFNAGIGIGVPIPVIKVTTRDGKTRQFVVARKEKDDWEQKIAQTAAKSKHNTSETIVSQSSNSNSTVCKSCGYSSAKSFKFCPECGANATLVNNCSECGTATVIEHNCPNCGTAYDDGQNFCIECGQALQ